ncbi:MAG: hypothetical protein ACJ8C4_12865 [Gemmataceae bacterium]
MRIEFYGMIFETPRVSFYLWAPWRASHLEHKLFEAVHALPGAQSDQNNDEVGVHYDDPKSVRSAFHAVARVLKGWQEEAEMGTDKRSWRWLLDGDTNADGYDHNGEPFGLWGVIRVSVDRGGLGESEKGEDIDLEGFGVRFSGEKFIK